MKLEILAPAGNMDSLIAAVRCGANAVYLGTKNMNARKNAGNFDNNQLKTAIEYCHCRNVKVYLTANTLVSDNEMVEAYNTIKYAMECGIDAFIVQDIGVAKMIKDHFPTAILHGSTQMSVMTVDGVNALKEMGFKRVVIPREMTASEIKEIKSNTDIEIEMFVHGALCMSVSGQCYLSSMIGGRSGNRGLCAQPCRLNFSADNSKSCDLSLKDLSLIDHINEIKNLGVTSIKIEGRMKRPEYVASTVTACKNAIESTNSFVNNQVLKSVFSRSGFTDGYFVNNMIDMFGTRQKDDVVSAKDVLKDLSHLYDNENPLLPIDLDFTCKKDTPCVLIAKAKGKTITVNGPVAETAINKPMTVETLTKRLGKFGNTQYYLNNINITLDDGLILPVSEINAMRRSVVEKLDEQTSTQVECLPLNIVSPNQKDGKPYYTARFTKASQIPENHSFKRVFLPIWEDDKNFLIHNAGVEIPRGLFGKETQLKQRLTQLKNAGVKMALCGNIGSYKTAKDMGFEVYGDFGLNIFNSVSANQINSPILSFELLLDKVNTINAQDTGIIAYGKLPLMLTRNCPIKNKIGCKQCGKKGVLTDRMGYKFSVKCSPYPCVEILNPLPLYMAERINEIKCDFIHFYFTDETREEVTTISNNYIYGKKYDDKYTRGLYYRGVE